MLKKIKEIREFLVVGLGLTALFSGVFFAIRDWGDVNPILSFLGGMVTGPRYLILGYGLLISSAYIGAELSERIGKPRRTETYGGRPEASDLEMGLCLFGGFVLSAVLLLPVFWIIPMIPVIGDQFAFIFRD